MGTQRAGTLRRWCDTLLCQTLSERFSESVWKSFQDSLTALCLTVSVCVCVCVRMCVPARPPARALRPALRSCDLRAQMCRPIDHKIGVPFWLWQLGCRWQLTSHYSPLLCAPLPFTPASTLSTLHISARPRRTLPLWVREWLFWNQLAPSVVN